MFDAVWNGDSEGITKEMNALLRRTISYHDYREDFYHAFLAGIFTGAGYMVDVFTTAVDFCGKNFLRQIRF